MQIFYQTFLEGKSFTLNPPLFPDRVKFTLWKIEIKVLNGISLKATKRSVLYCFRRIQIRENEIPEIVRHVATIFAVQYLFLF
jgi:hypothetical protein